MKRSVHPLSTILLVAAIAFTVTFGFATLRSERNVFPVEAQALPVVFNSTLLKFAAIDVGEASLRQEIEQLLEGNFRTRARHRSISSWRRFRPYPQNPRTSNGVPIDFRSPKFYRLWLQFRMVLQAWARNRRHQPEIMSDLARLVKYPIDGSAPRYSSCAVVGNSGILLHKDYGELIDSHEVVVRLNNARVKNYQRHVGSKTNVSFVNSNILHLCARREGCFCHPYGLGVPIVMYICQPAHFLDYMICNSSHRGPLLITDPRFDLLCARIVKYYSAKRFVEDLGRPLEKWSSTHEGTMFHYSSGMQAVMLALGICNRVSIFGFGKSALAKHHYHSNQKQELHLHDYEAEYAFYHDLVVQPQAVPFISNKFRFPPVSLYQ